MNFLTRTISSVRSRKTNPIFRRLRLSRGAGLLLPVLLLLVLSVTAHAQTTADGLSYTIATGRVSITGYSGTNATVNIPSVIIGLPVTGIQTFSVSLFGPPVTSVTIPSSVTWIDFYAFSGCSDLASITVDSQNPTYSSLDGVLYNKSKTLLLQCPAAKFGSVTIPSTVTGIGPYALYDCYNMASITVDSQNSTYCSVDGILFNHDQTSLIQCPAGRVGNVTIPNGVTTIGGQAFSYCCGLTSVTIPDTVTTIATSAFSWTGIASVTIPKSVTTIGNCPFLNCFNLTSITVDSQNSAYIGVDGVLLNKSQTTLVQYPRGKSSTSYTIPSSVTGLGASSFAGCSLTKVTIPNSVMSIGDSAFESCNSLTSVTIPSSVASIGNFVFSSCSRLRTAIFMGDAPSMGKIAFWGAPGFAVYYFNGATGFTSPLWKDNSGDSYTAVNMGLSSPVAPWLLSNGFAHNADLQSAPNGDGLPLLMAYALNLDPTRNQSRSIPQPVVSGSNLSLTYYAASEGITYNVETSIDLKNWDTTGVTLSGPDANNCYTATVPMADPHRFMRLVVVLQ